MEGEGEGRKMTLSERAAEQREICRPQDDLPNSNCAMLECYFTCPICAIEAFDPFAPAMESEDEEEN
jgi:hypothetical protein